MMDAGVTGLGLEAVARAIASRDLSSVEVTTACLDRLHTVAETLNAVAELDRETALSAAADADDHLAANGPRGPLHGVPLGHKDMYDRAGRECGCGSALRAGFIPEVTATALVKLDHAGALDVARLNMVEFALGTSGHNSYSGDVYNPWNPAYITGGSSSGSGAALGARAIYGALGSDTGGSIRLPAACCGVVGIKPSTGRVSRHGAMPLSTSLDTVGPMARTVRDVAILLGVVAGYDPLDPTTIDRPVPDYLAAIENGVAGLRIAVPENYFFDPATDDVQAVLDEVIRTFEHLGAKIVRATIPGVEIANTRNGLIITAEAAALHRDRLAARQDDYGDQTLAGLKSGLEVLATDYIDALNSRRTVLAAFNDAVFDRDADLVLTPTIPIPVPSFAELGRPGSDRFKTTMITFGHCVRPFNYAGLPAMSVPAGFADNGMPVAFQLAGRPFAEALVLQAGRAYEREVAWAGSGPI